MRLVIIATAALSLAGCDMIAGEVQGQIRDEFVQRCEGIAEDVGLGADAINPMCGCAADKIAEKDAAELAGVDRQRVEEILRECAAEAGGDAFTNLTV